ncbi:MAG: cyclic nucleotide-binding protein [Gammaproteobacteria bacterium]|nr:cyclic nucleotide-binding protein [Gammaproteobacteria bacterium]
MEFSLPDALGLVGVALILAAYALLQAGAWSPRNAAYSFANALGAALILFSLVFDFNLPAAVIEGCWLLISLFGLWRNRRAPA